MKVINIVTPQSRLRYAEVAGNTFSLVPASNTALKVDITDEEFASVQTANILKLSIAYDVQDEELFFDNITLYKVKSENNDYLVFCGGCLERNGSFYTVTAVIHSQNPEIRLYFSIAY